MIVGIVQVELHIPEAQTLKDKRAVLKSVKGEMRSRFNISIAEVDANEKWQRATLGIAAVGQDRAALEPSVNEFTQWIRRHPLIQIIRIDQEYW